MADGQSAQAGSSVVGFVGAPKPAQHGSAYNGLADMSLDEFECQFRGCSLQIPAHDRAKLAPVSAELLSAEEVAAAPAAVDWREQNAVSEVKNQQRCGSCWSFSTTGALESAWYLATGGGGGGGGGGEGGTMEPLSEQTLVSCEADCNGCNGGFPYKAMDWVAFNGIDTEASYPYDNATAKNGTVPECDVNGTGRVRAAVQATGHQLLNRTEEYMAAFVAKYGPVSIALDDMGQLWFP